MQHLTRKSLDGSILNTRHSVPHVKGQHFYFWKSCASVSLAEEPDLNRMIENSVQVTYRTFRKGVGGDKLDGWARLHGYLKHPKQGLTLKSDWHVGYFKSTWAGKPCWYLVWSAYEMIWRIAE